MINKGFLTEKLNTLYYPPAKNILLPSIVMIEPTNVCNLKCSMCYVQQNTKGRDYLSLSDFQKIINQFPKIKELVLCGIGEPLLNRDIFNMISFAKSKNIGFVNMFTNGLLLTEDVSEQIIKTGINRIQISVQSFNKEIFTKIRNENIINLEKLKRNIKQLISIKKKVNSPLKVCCNAVITMYNYNDLIEFINDAEDLGVERVEFFQMTTASDNMKDINAPLDYMAKIIREIRKYAQKLNIEVGFLSGNDYGRCYQLWNFIMIHANGNVSPCNGIFPTENIKIGNILDIKIEQIWNSSKYQELRQLMRKGKLKYCKYCETGYCLEGKNIRWFKNYYLRPLKRLIRSMYAR